MFGAFDRVADAALNVPDFVGAVRMHTRIGAGVVSEGAAKPLRRLDLTEVEFTPVKSVAVVAATREYVDALTPAGMAALERELASAIAVDRDARFLAALSGNSGESSIVTATWQAFLDQVEELLRLLGLGVSSQPFLIVAPEMAKGMAMQALANGVDSLRWDGGNLGGVPILVSDAQTAGTVTAVDGTGLVVKRGELEVRSSAVADYELEDAPSQTSSTSIGQASMTSAFQTNTYILRAEADMMVKAIRPDAHAHLTGVTLGDDGGSPTNS
jgi:hypothetical protein